jgi:hypothetical protein
MTEQQLKVRLGFTIIGLNIGILIIQALFFYTGGFNFDQVTTVIAVTTPMFSCHAVAALRYLASERFVKNDESKKLTPSFILLSFLTPVAFAFAIAATMYMQAKGGSTFSNFEEFKRALLLLEALFSAYVGNTIYAMFSPVEESHKAILK